VRCVRNALETAPFDNAYCTPFDLVTSASTSCPSAAPPVSLSSRLAFRLSLSQLCSIVPLLYSNSLFLFLDLTSDPLTRLDTRPDIRRTNSHIRSRLLLKPLGLLSLSSTLVYLIPLGSTLQTRTKHTPISTPFLSRLRRHLSLHLRHCHRHCFPPPSSRPTSTVSEFLSLRHLILS